MSLDSEDGLPFNLPVFPQTTIDLNEMAPGLQLDEAPQTNGHEHQTETLKAIRKEARYGANKFAISADVASH